MRRGQRTYRPDNMENRHTCSRDHVWKRLVPRVWWVQETICTPAAIGLVAVGVDSVGVGKRRSELRQITTCRPKMYAPKFSGWSPDYYNLLWIFVDLLYNYFMGHVVLNKINSLINWNKMRRRRARDRRTCNASQSALPLPQGPPSSPWHSP